MDKILIWKNIEGKDYCVRVPSARVVQVLPDPNGNRSAVIFDRNIRRGEIDEIIDVPIEPGEVGIPDIGGVWDFVQYINQPYLYLPTAILRYLEARRIAIRSGLADSIINAFFRENGFSELIIDIDYRVRANGMMISLEFTSLSGRAIAMKHGITHNQHTFVL